MNLSRVITWLRQAAKALAVAFLFTTLLPLILGSALGISFGRVLSLVSSTIILQANAAFVGLGMGLAPLVVLVIMTLVEIGMVLAIFYICDAFALTSERVRDLLERTEKKMEKMTILSKFGAATLIVLPAVPFLGLYSSAVIGWILQWDRRLSLLFITIGWILITTVLLLLSLGVFSVIF